MSTACEVSLSRLLPPLLVAAALLLAGCSGLRDARTPSRAGDAESSARSGAAPAPAAARPRSAPAAGPPDTDATEAGPPAPFVEVVARSGDRLIQDARSALGTSAREIAIDAFVDAGSGEQTIATKALAEQLAALVKTRAPQWQARPLRRANLAARPLLLIGTLTAIHSNEGRRREAPADAFRICLAIADLGTGKLVARRIDRATAASVNAEPLPFFRETPTWSLDRTMQAYIRSCQNAAPGDAVDAGYLQRLPAAALIHEAHSAYADGRHADALKLFREAQPLAAAGDLRVLNGVYLAGWKSGRKKEATEAFGRIVGAGLQAKRLPIKLLFAPGTTAFAASNELQTQYVIWLREIAQQAGGRESCIRVVGHTSRGGSAAANEALSLRRAAAVKQALERLNKSLASRVEAVGAGSREAIIDLGTDDLRDALDRRVEFRTVDCA